MIAIREIVGKNGSCEAKIVVERGPICAFIAACNKRIAASRNDDNRSRACRIFVDFLSDKSNYQDVSIK